MNKEEIEQKLEEIIENNSYETEYTTEYYADKIAKQAFNLALELAAENVTLLEDGKSTNCKRCIIPEGNHYSETEVDIDKQSILNLKL